MSGSIFGLIESYGSLNILKRSVDFFKVADKGNRVSSKCLRGDILGC